MPRKDADRTLTKVTLTIRATDCFWHEALTSDGPVSQGKPQFDQEDLGMSERITPVLHDLVISLNQSSKKAHSVMRIDRRGQCSGPE
ncbi:hypothetical protein NDU88_004657 [Pleurodeles waltl]|uniref:Uncharacterized protein n=1 Tax=Pleurodeles waltl TaxID=8319 RepID=A0AAV7NKE9_PLEWA|nr:hypothetical protein NDU88_004657 [Pleurodeles waltl]